MRFRSRCGRGGGHRPIRSLLFPALLLAFVAWVGVTPTAAQDSPKEDATAPPVPLDALLKLPSAVAPPTEQPSRGGITRKEWEERFAGTKADLEAARERLASAQTQLGELAANTESWQVTAPGAPAGSSGENGPLSYSLRQEIRRAREDIASAEQAYHELRIEANFAGVPPEWMGDPPEGLKSDPVPAGR